MTAKLTSNGEQLIIGANDQLAIRYYKSNSVVITLYERAFVVYPDEVDDLIAFLTYHRNRVRNG